MDTLPSEIIYHILTYCDRYLRYFSTVNDRQYRQYFDNDEKVLFLHTKYGFGDYRKLQKYSKSFGKFFEYLGCQDDKIVNKYIKKIYDCPDDIEKFTTRVSNDIELGTLDFERMSPGTMMKMHMYDRPKDWYKYIINDVETVFKLLIGRISVDPECFDMISDDIWKVLATDIRFSWANITKNAAYMPMNVKKVLSNDELKMPPKYLEKYMYEVTLNVLADPECLVKLFEMLVEYPKYAIKFISSYSYLFNRSRANNDKITTMLAECVVMYYKKYKYNLHALLLMYGVSWKYFDNKYMKTFRNIEKKLDNARIITKKTINLPSNPTPYEYLKFILYGLSKRTIKVSEINYSMLEGNEYYINVLSIALQLHNGIYNKKYADIPMEYKKHITKIRVEIEGTV